MVAVDPTHLAARVTPFGVGVNAPDVQMPKFGEFSSIFGLFCWVSGWRWGHDEVLGIGSVGGG